ncbi:SSI family serine proteinase inhibitor [Saccharothrix syringae]|uniref:Serine protease n=1 Tax=Saccharothrix syringae TaxID=103733 RepID=A0A5Q0HA42_SACSY|nr:SSI family serine proteinase inhibitor [Saccharothrix syringae]QFZ23118.1 serine protease [Saccharothrix syringae]
MAPLPLLAAIAALVPGFVVPESSFVLSTTRAGALQIVNLTCEPAGGLHPRADETCLALSGADGQVGDLPPGEAVCTLEYAPVRVKASGRWRGERRTFEAEFPNACVMRAQTGPVFDF